MNVLYVGSRTSKAKLIHDFIQKTYPNFLTEKNPELIIVAGGDGSMLHAIQKFKHLNAPFFGIGSGTLNFIMNTVENYEEFFSILKETSFERLSTKTIKATINNNIVVEAINEISFGGGFMDYHKFKLNSSSFEDYSFKGQGLIVSSPLGSTAISYNNGGQIIPSIELPLWAVTSCISEKAKSFKKLVESKEGLRIDIEEQRGLYFIDNKRIETESSNLFIDGGTVIHSLKKGDVVVLEEGQNIELCFLNKEEFSLKRLRF